MPGTGRQSAGAGFSKVTTFAARFPGGLFLGLRLAMRATGLARAAPIMAA